MSLFVRIRRPICIVLLLCVLLTLCFIFGNSMASREASGAASDKINDIVSGVIESVTGKEDTAVESFFVTYSRKIAHVIEFALLGFEIFLLIYFLRLSGVSVHLSGLLLSFLVASVDEGIQIVSGRGDLVSDIFIDASGYIGAYLVCALVFFLFSWRKKRKKRRTADTVS